MRLYERRLSLSSRCKRDRRSWPCWCRQGHVRAACTPTAYKHMLHCNQNRVLYTIGRLSKPTRPTGPGQTSDMHAHAGNLFLAQPHFPPLPPPKKKQLCHRPPAHLCAGTPKHAHRLYHGILLPTRPPPRSIASDPVDTIAEAPFMPTA